MNESRLEAYALRVGSSAVFAAAGMATADIVTSDAVVDVSLGAAFDGSAWTYTKLFEVGTDNAGIYALNTVAGDEDSEFRWVASFLSYYSVARFAAVNAGESISGLAFAPGDVNWARTASYVSTGTDIDGPMALGTDQLVAFKLTASTGIHFGWINFDLVLGDTPESRHTFIVNAWAYNDVAGEGIIAGQNVAAGSNVVPGLGGLAALAIGAAGVRSQRSRSIG